MSKKTCFKISHIFGKVYFLGVRKGLALLKWKSADCCRSLRFRFVMGGFPQYIQLHCNPKAHSKYIALSNAVHCRI